MLEYVGWMLVGTTVGFLLYTAIDRFWNSIAGWLNNTAANAVEKVLGYNARVHMQRAVATVTRIRERLHNSTVVYSKRNALDTHLHKVTLSSTAPVYEQEQEVKELFERESVQINEFEYHN